MSIEINYLAVFLAAVSSMVVGSLWYMPAGFGTAWMKLAGVKMNKNKSQDAGKMAWMYGSVFVASLVTAFVLAYVAFLLHSFMHDSWLGDALWTAAILWLGFTATRLYVHMVRLSSAAKN